MRVSFQIVVLAAALACAGARAGLDEGSVAMRAGDYRKALAEYQAAADSGNPDALFNVSVMKLRGFGTQADVPAALQLMRSAGELGSDLARETLYGMLSSGKEFVTRDDVEALRWATLLAQSGRSEYQMKVARAHLWGIGTKKDVAAALPWLRYAGAAGVGEAQGELGRLYATGAGVAQDPVRALALFKVATINRATQFEGAAGPIESTLSEADRKAAASLAVALSTPGQFAAALDASVPATAPAPQSPQKKAATTRAKSAKPKKAASKGSGAKPAIVSPEKKP
jgi:hypothetical protein